MFQNNVLSNYKKKKVPMLFLKFEELRDDPKN